MKRHVLESSGDSRGDGHERFAHLFSSINQ
jgi:hypothetical protein